MFGELCEAVVTGANPPNTSDSVQQNTNVGATEELGEGGGTGGAGACEAVVTETNADSDVATAAPSVTTTVTVTAESNSNVGSETGTTDNLEKASSGLESADAATTKAERLDLEHGEADTAVVHNAAGTEGQNTLPGATTSSNSGNAGEDTMPKQVPDSTQEAVHEPVSGGASQLENPENSSGDASGQVIDVNPAANTAQEAETSGDAMDAEAAPGVKSPHPTAVRDPGTAHTVHEPPAAGQSDTTTSPNDTQTNAIPAPRPLAIQTNTIAVAATDPTHIGSKHSDVINATPPSEGQPQGAGSINCSGNPANEAPRTGSPAHASSMDGMVASGDTVQPLPRRASAPMDLSRPGIPRSHDNRTPTPSATPTTVDMSLPADMQTSARDHQAPPRTAETSTAIANNGLPAATARSEEAGIPGLGGLDMLALLAARNSDINSASVNPGQAVTPSLELKRTFSSSDTPPLQKLLSELAPFCDSDASEEMEMTIFTLAKRAVEDDQEGGSVQLWLNTTSWTGGAGLFEETSLELVTSLRSYLGLPALHPLTSEVEAAAPTQVDASSTDDRMDTDATVATVDATLTPDDRKDTDTARTADSGAAATTAAIETVVPAGGNLSETTADVPLVVHNADDATNINMTNSTANPGTSTATTVAAFFTNTTAAETETAPTVPATATAIANTDTDTDTDVAMALSVVAGVGADVTTDTTAAPPTPSATGDSDAANVTVVTATKNASTNAAAVAATDAAVQEVTATTAAKEGASSSSSSSPDAEACATDIPEGAARDTATDKAGAAKPEKHGLLDTLAELFQDVNPQCNLIKRKGLQDVYTIEVARLVSSAATLDTTGEVTAWLTEHTDWADGSFQSDTHFRRLAINLVDFLTSARYKGPIVIPVWKTSTTPLQPLPPSAKARKPPAKAKASAPSVPSGGATKNSDTATAAAAVDQDASDEEHQVAPTATRQLRTHRNTKLNTASKAHIAPRFQIDAKLII